MELSETSIKSIELMKLSLKKLNEPMVLSLNIISWFFWFLANGSLIFMLISICEFFLFIKYFSIKVKFSKKFSGLSKLFVIKVT